MVLRQAIIENAKRAKREGRLQQQHYFAPLKEESRKRADDLKSYAGDTALPGGKREKGDKSPEDTARREAYEEPALNTPEVSILFSHPLRSLIVPPPSFPSLYHSQLSASDMNPEAPTPPSDQPPYHTFNDIEWGEPKTHVRIHKFLTGKEPNVKPLFGLTAAILLRVATIGYADVRPDFDIEAPDQRSMQERLFWAMLNEPKLVEACKKEGIQMKRNDGSAAAKTQATFPLSTPAVRVKNQQERAHEAQTKEEKSP
ncbi:hypothetical protein FRC04_007917 [Tulasnella sp. 424]|nr:hypothetical protein FRC04_007917 [Tulasnella sp. 424]